MKIYKIKNGLSNVKPPTLEDLDYRLSRLEEAWYKKKQFEEDVVRKLELKVEELEEDPTILDVIKVWIRRFLDVKRRWHD